MSLGPNRSTGTNPITDHLDLWTSATKKKATVGRGKNGKTSPHGINKLRELILELAVRGKLVPQDSNDEPASVLLEKIAEEKARLVNSGKLKRQLALPEITEDEKLFDLPDGWCLTRFGTVFELEYGNNLPKTKRTSTGEYPVYGSNGIVGTHDSFSVAEPCIVVGRKGSAGALNLCLDNGCWVTDVAYSTVPPRGIDLEFSFKLFHTLRLDGLGKGIKPGLTRKEAYVLVVAIPPLPEQHRIVAKVDELMALCDQLEQQQTDSLHAHQTLVRVFLGRLVDQANTSQPFHTELIDAFDTLFTTEESIDQLKQTILQLAVMGKLVPQNPNDEPASVLLEKIAAEKARLIKDKKIKKQKPLPPISDEEKPFELPAGWEFSRLQNSIDVRDGTHDSPQDAPGGNSYPLVTSKNFIDGEIDFEAARMISEEDHIEISKRSLVEVDDILFSMIGGNIGNQVIVKDSRPFSVKNVALFKYYSRAATLPTYFKLYTEELAIELQHKASGGAQPFVSLGSLRRLIFALPPLKEQHRIVAKTDELMTLCDTLKARLNEAQTTQAQLADAVVEQAIQ